jgi:putative intracellular protease/amidase
MNIRSLLISTLVLAAVSLTSALVFAQPKPVEPAFSEEAVRKAALETNAKVSPQVASDKGAPKVLLFIRDQGSDQLEYMLVNEVGPMRKILAESGFDVTIASISGKTIKTNSVTVTPDCELKRVKIDDYAGFILPCMANDSAPSESVAFVREIVNKGKPIAAQLGAVNVLGKAGVLSGKKFAFAEEKDFNTSMYPALKGGIYSGSGVVQDGVIITSGTCPMMSKMHGHQDCTAELTRTLIGVMTTRTR